MLKKFLFSALILCLNFVLCSLGYATMSDTHDRKGVQLAQCLEEYWGVDRYTSAYIVRKFDLLLQDPYDHHIIDGLIEKSKNLNIDFLAFKEIQRLPEDDGVLRAPEQHLVVFENPYVRILWGSTASGESEPFHVHAWKSLMVVLKPTTYEVAYPNGVVEIWEGNRGLYELPANERYACTNIGDTADEILRFEIKD